MMIKRKYASFSVLALSLLIAFNQVSAKENPEAAGNQSVQVKKHAPKKIYSLRFDAKNFKDNTVALNGENISFRSYENIVYVANPASKSSQMLSIYIPNDYLKGKTINGYSAKTAPIFMPNGVGGYMPGDIKSPTEKRFMGHNDASLMALSRGYVVVAPAVRGRTTQNTNGVYVGKAPALIVDYKAAVRYLRYNKDALPAGDVEKIITNGTSAGGALSALIGASGNAPEYESYLKRIGAAVAFDNVFAVSAYCPITNLENADMAYEWIFSGVNEYHQSKNPPMPLPTDNKAVDTNNEPMPERPQNAPLESLATASMSAEQQDASKELKEQFSPYINSLKLKDESGKVLKLNKNGTGSFADYIKDIYKRSAQKAFDAGEDLSNLEWLTIENGKVTDADLAKYALWATRLKATPAFDKFDLSSGENDEFGDRHNRPMHFTQYSAKKADQEECLADKKVIELMNPMTFMNKNNVKFAKHWRIRHGAKDRDTSIAVPAILALSLENKGLDVDFSSPWGYGHAGDYDLEELFDWIDSICR